MCLITCAVIEGTNPSLGSLREAYEDSGFFFHAAKLMFPVVLNKHTFWSISSWVENAGHVAYMLYCILATLAHVRFVLLILWNRY